MLATLADLVVPVGPIDPETVWPADTPEQRTAKLTGFLEAGERKVAEFSDATLARQGAVWWAAYRIRDTLYQALIRTPAHLAKEGEGSQGTLGTQIQLVGEERAAALAEYRAIELEALGEEDPEETFTTLRSMRDGL